MKIFFLQPTHRIYCRISVCVIFAWQAIGQAISMQAISMNAMDPSDVGQSCYKSSDNSAIQAKNRRLSSLKKRRFSLKEDLRLCQLVHSFGTSDWKKIAALMDRSPRQCRERWSNFLSNITNRPHWTQEHDALLLDLWHVFGNNWKKISAYFKGFSPTQVHYRLLKLLQQKEKQKKGILNQEQEVSDTVEHDASTVSIDSTEAPIFDLNIDDLSIVLPSNPLSLPLPDSQEFVDFDTLVNRTDRNDPFENQIPSLDLESINRIETLTFDTPPTNFSVSSNTLEPCHLDPVFEPLDSQHVTNNLFKSEDPDWIARGLSPTSYHPSSIVPTADMKIPFDSDLIDSLDVPLFYWPQSSVGSSQSTKEIIFNSPNENDL